MEGKDQQIRIITPLFILMCLVVSVPAFTSASEKSQDDNYNSISGLRYHGPIEIDGSSDLGSSEIIYSGTGSPEDPYVLESYLIEKKNRTGIVISNNHHHMIIRECVVSLGIFEGASGILIVNSTNITIEYSELSNCLVGIMIENSTGIRVVDTNIHSNHYGMNITGGSRNSVLGCDIIGCLIDGINVIRSPQTVIEKCFLMGNSGRISYDQAVHITDSSYSMIRGCEMRMNCGTAVQIDGSIEGTSPIAGIRILDTKIHYNKNGIVISGAEDFRIIRCDIEYNWLGLAAFDSTGSEVTGCGFLRNDKGISMKNLSGSSLTSIDFRECGYGMKIQSCRENNILENRFNRSRLYDIHISEPDEGGCLSRDNKIIMNIFESEPSRYPATDNGIDNIWDDGEQGNTWIVSNRMNICCDWSNGTVRINGTAGSSDSCASIIEMKLDKTDDHSETELNGGNDRDRLMVVLSAMIIGMISVVFSVVLFSIFRKDNGKHIAQMESHSMR